MTETTDRCPLCGGDKALTNWHGHGLRGVCEGCDLWTDLWPRVRELAAIRDAAVEWSVSWADDRRYEQACENLARLASEEANDGQHR